MKGIKTTLAAIAMAAFAMPSLAQQGWESVYVEYNAGTQKYDFRDGAEFSVNGLTLGYSKAFNVLQGSELFVEAGAGLQYTFSNSYYDETWEDEMNDDDIDAKMNMFTVKVPVNLAYKWKMNNGKVDIIPFAGLNAKYHISGQIKYEYYTQDEKLNPFDKKDMEGSDATWTHFQIGWQIGAKIRFNDSFYAGVSYGADFTELCKKFKTSQTTITAGFCF